VFSNRSPTPSAKLYQKKEWRISRSGRKKKKGQNMGTRPSFIHFSERVGWVVRNESEFADLARQERKSRKPRGRAPFSRKMQCEIRADTTRPLVRGHNRALPGKETVEVNPEGKETDGSHQSLTAYKQDVTPWSVTQRQCSRKRHFVSVKAKRAETLEIRGNLEKIIGKVSVTRDSRLGRKGLPSHR